MQRVILSGKNLAIQRKKKRMTTQTLAKKLGNNVTSETIVSWEKGTAKIPLTYYGILWEIFGDGIIDELQILPVRLKNIFLESFRQYGLNHNRELGYTEFDGDDMFLKAILEIANIALKKSTRIKREIVLSPCMTKHKVIIGKAYTKKGIAIGNNFEDEKIFRDWKNL